MEESIINGIQACTSETLWTQKTKWLYDLRSELVHGGARYEKEWKDYERYLAHFETHPFEDVMDLAFLCILKTVLPTIDLGA